MGVLLFQRSTRRFTLTSHGETLFQQLQPVALELRQAVGQTQQEQSSPMGQIRMTAPLDMGTLLLAEPLGAFQSQYPAIQLTLEFTDRLVDLIGERFDLALRAGRLPDSSLKAKVVGETCFGLFASKQYLQQNSKIKNPGDLLKHRGLVFTGRARMGGWTLQSGPLKQPITFASTTHSSSLPFLLQMTAIGSGVSILPTYLMGCGNHSKILARVLPDWVSGREPVSLVYPPYRKLPIRLELLIQHLQKALEKPLRSRHGL